LGKPEFPQDYPPPAALRLSPIDAGATLRDQACDLLRRAIVDADIYGRAEEIRLDEHQLEAALGVSRTPIREAMTLLEREGLLHTVPRRGIYILRKTLREVVEAIHFWAALESMAARLAIQRSAGNDADAFVAMVEGALTGEPDEAPGEFSRANVAFHQGIVQLGGSSLLQRAARPIVIHIGAVLQKLADRPDIPGHNAAAHRRIVHALSSRKIEAVEQTITEHAFTLAEMVIRHANFLR
jgi:DNA-binding GntR family transcriptional regulator